MNRLLKMPLLARIIVAIVLGVAIGQVAGDNFVRVFLTFNAVFAQFLNFLVPLIIVGLVTSAIADIGRGAGRLLAITVAIAYADTVLAGLLAYGTGEALFPAMVAGTQNVAVAHAAELKPFVELQIPPMIDVMSALVLSFVLGLGIAYKQTPALHHAFSEFNEIISAAISKAIIPLLPIYIFGIFLSMTHSGEAYRILAVFAQIIVVIVVLHIVILLYENIFVGTVA